MAALQVGDMAPDFALPSTRGEVRLSGWLQRGPVLLVFYPGDDTAVCTRQLCDYRDNLEGFGELGVQVIAINSQSLDSHESFAKKHEFEFPIVADPERKACRAYGAVGLFGMTKRSLFLIGRDGRVLYEHTDLPIFRRTAAQIEAVIADLELS